MAQLPRQLKLQMGTELGFLHNRVSGRRSIFSRIHFLSDVQSDDLILLGCKLTHTRFTPSAMDEYEYIMLEGERGVSCIVLLVETRIKTLL